MKHFKPRIHPVFLAAAAISFVSLSAFAQQQDKPWDKIPTPKLHEFKPQNPKKIVLKNGIVIFLQEDHELPFVSGYVLIPGGSRDEDPAKTGLVSLYGQAWRNSGTEKLDGDAMDDLLEAKAASINTGGSEDSTSLSWDSLKGDSDQVFDLAMELLLHPKFRPEKLQLAQQQDATGITRRNDDASGIASREAERLVYGTTGPYGRQPELATIGAVTVKDIEAWHDKTIGGKLLFAVSGDFDPAAMEAKLRKALEPLPAVKVAPARHDEFSSPKQAIYFINKDDVNQSNIDIVGLGTDRHNPDLATLVVMNEIFGGGFGSRLFQKIRTEMGLAYAVGGSYGLTWDHPGLFRIVVSTKSASTVDATKAVLTEVEKLRTMPFTDVELKRAKEQILNSFLFRYDTRDKVLNARVLLEYYGYPENYLETYKAGVEKVTTADLERVAKKYIDPAKLDVLVVGNEKEIQPSLDTVGLGTPKSIDITIPMPRGMASPGPGGTAGSQR
jgi:zinc protease